MSPFGSEEALAARSTPEYAAPSAYRPRGGPADCTSATGQHAYAYRAGTAVPEYSACSQCGRREPWRPWGCGLLTRASAGAAIGSGAASSLANHRRTLDWMRASWARGLRGRLLDGQPSVARAEEIAEIDWRTSVMYEQHTVWMLEGRTAADVDALEST